MSSLCSGASLIQRAVHHTASKGTRGVLCAASHHIQVIYTLLPQLFACPKCSLEVVIYKIRPDGLPANFGSSVACGEGRIHHHIRCSHGDENNTTTKSSLVVHDNRHTTTNTVLSFRIPTFGSLRHVPGCRAVASPVHNICVVEG